MPEVFTPQRTGETDRPSAVSAIKLLVAVTCMTAWMATLFIRAGTLDWPRGWLFVVVYGAT
jgi:hypothetical protein